MLNINYSKEIKEKETKIKAFKLSAALTQKIFSSNACTDTQDETRLSEYFSYELRHRLNLLKVHQKDFVNKSVLDIASGTGFLSYHFIKYVANYSQLTLMDISENEVERSKVLLKDDSVTYKVENIFQHKLKYDVVIGNSFLHHFPDVQAGIKKIYEMVEDDGQFIVLHEPSPAAFMLEQGSIKGYLMYLLKGDSYIDKLRPNLGFPEDYQDVFVFHAEEMKRMLLEAGFKDVTIVSQHLLKSLVHKIVLKNSSSIAKPLSSFLLKAMLFLDKLLTFLPNRYFGSILFVCKK